MKKMTKAQENAPFGPEDHEGKIVSKHTPGPWEVDGSDATSDNSTYSVYGADGNPICGIVTPKGFYRTPRETEANALLIVSAPALLDACETILKYALRPINEPCFLQSDIKMIDAAICKARGIKQ